MISEKFPLSVSWYTTFAGNDYRENRKRAPPVIGERSERKVFKTERSCKIVLPAMKQSLKAKLAVVEAPVSVRDFILAHREDAGIKMICYCSVSYTHLDVYKRQIEETLASAWAWERHLADKE